MSVIKIENRGKNLAKPEILRPEYCIQVGSYAYKDFGNMRGSLKVAEIPPTDKQLYLKLHWSAYNKDTDWNIMMHVWVFNSKLINLGLAGYSYLTTYGMYKLLYTDGIEADLTIALPILDVPYTLVLSNRTAAWSIFENIIVTEDQNAEFEPPRTDYIEFNQELFGYAGIYDELQDDGTLIKRWKRETGRTITSGAGQVSSSGTGTCILINETTGLPYEGTVSSTSISTSAPDGTYTVIYQLATPEIINLNYDGELMLHPGENNLILPDCAVASISGARKYLEG